MPSLRHLIAAHPALLVVDTCSTRAEAALWLNQPAATGGVSTKVVLPPARQAFCDGEAAHALPEVVSSVLGAAGLKINQLDAVAFCTGPGSVLGIRIAAASIRVWRTVRPGLEVYGYLSLPLLATHPDSRNSTVIADARRETWHAVRPDASGKVERIPSAALTAAGALITPSSFRRWSALPSSNPPRESPYHPAELLAAAPDVELFTRETDPDAFMHEQPSYVAWTPRVHQAVPSP